ncbi:mediator of RNA polymerase II transcription subunit 9-like [Dendronephthya gigantea]|uniref:mediator of RNA polymerase II transcription subunit 9-like n=1 Tax=Dendronephthya gigantea TaxID=151771 RepID=UPI00106A4339|nr:mediator of RNA polymerase II transcription subunit 9-like [Dendronephthya gigantea]
MAASEQQNIDLPKEFSLLPAVYDILKSIEKTNDSNEVTRKVAVFHEKIQSCRELLEKIPGVDTNMEKQKRELEFYQNKYKEKCELLEQYRTLPLFTQNPNIQGQ